MQSPRVLLIEPDKILAAQTSAYLSSHGFSVQVVHDAQQAIIAVDKSPVDIVVLEVVLAQHSGIEFLYEFRSYGEWRSVPAIVLSRVRGQELGLTPKIRQQLGVGAVLYKPEASLAALMKNIEKLLGNSR